MWITVPLLHSQVHDEPDQHWAAAVDYGMGLKLAVRGALRACAQVPYTQPERASYLFKQWVTNSANAPIPTPAADFLQ